MLINCVRNVVHSLAIANLRKDKCYATQYSFKGFLINQRNLILFGVKGAGALQIKLDLCLKLLVYQTSLKLDLFDQIIVNSNTQTNH
jgi:hypothetical protein